MRDQCPHCLEKFEREPWIERSGCPHCGKKIIIEEFDGSGDAYAGLPKKPPRLDWFIIPFGGLIAGALPVVRWVVQWALAMFTVVDSAVPLWQPILAVASGGAAWSAVYFRLKRRTEVKYPKYDQPVATLRLGFQVASAVLVLVYLVY